MSSRAVEVPFEIPASWRWVRLGDIGIWGAGATPNKSIRKYFENGTIPWLLTGDLNDSLITEIPNVITECALNETSIKLNPTGSVLIAMYGATIGKVGVLDIAATTNQACCACRPFNGVINWYLFYFLMSQREAFISRGEGGAQSNISKEKIVATLFPLPPLAEQKRIVAKIEKLMPLVEEYGKMEEVRLQLDADLPSALEKSILQEAIQGKLVPQDPNDEPASELLKRIAAERKALVKAGKLKRDKTESVIFRGSDRLAYETRNGETVCIQDEIPFDIPDSWEWVRLENITTFLHRGKSPTYVPHSDCPMFAQKCNQWDGIHLEKCKFCDEAKYKTFQGEYHLRDYDVVVNSTGTGTLGRVGIFHDSELAKHGYLSIVPDSHVTVVRTSLHDLSQYIYHYLCTKFCWEWMNNNADGSTKQKELYTSTLASLLIPIPPLAEQRRIASAIPLLLNNCNQLKQQPTM